MYIWPIKKELMDAIFEVLSDKHPYLQRPLMIK